MFLTILGLLILSLRQAESRPTVFAQTEKLALRSAVPDRKQVPLYEKCELTLDLHAAYSNPFDPEDIDVHAEFTSPQGRTRTVNGFLYQPYTRRLENRSERIEPAGSPVWKIRFAPDAVGTWRYRVIAKDRTGTAALPEASIKVVESGLPGFIGRSTRNPAVFAYVASPGEAPVRPTDEKPFFAVGENMCWAGQRGSYDFEEWLPALSQHGGNWIRIWTKSNGGGVEWTTDGKTEQRDLGYHGLGVYSLDNAWYIDELLDLAEKNHIAVMLCLGTYGEFTTGGFFNEGQWKANPYNAANGGPCAKPEDFWTNPSARKLYQRRLRYLAARYGYRTNLHSWEFWNEANPPASWVGEMARYLKGIGEFANHPADPFHHLVSTTYGNDAIWKLPEVDFTMTHHYGTGEIPDHAPVIHSDALRHAEYGKPHLMAEYGLDWRAPDAKYDPEGKGINLHNGLWSSVCSGNAGGAMLWWWDNYIAPKDLYGPFLPVRKFADTVHWTAGVFKPLEFDPAAVKEGTETFTDLTLAADSGWGKAAKSDFTITPLGVKNSLSLPQFLYSPGKADLRTTPTFHVNFAKPGRFSIRVNTVSDSAHLRFLLDGKPAKEVTLSAAPPKDGIKPQYETTEFKKEYGIYQARYNKEIGMEVPAGEHNITLENTVGDWASVESYTLTAYRSSRYPALNLYGLSDGREAVIWAQNALHNWKNVAEKKPIPTLQNVSTVARGFAPGRYTIEWWDTDRGIITSRESVTATSGGLALHLPSIETDVAAHIIAGRP